MYLAKDRTDRREKHFSILAILLVFLFVSWILVPNHVQHHDDPSKGQDVCVDENYSLPWEQDLPLLEYVRDTNTFIGREWLFETLGWKLLQDKSLKRGLVSVAEFGYGKSAIVSHLLCSRPGEKGRNLREHIAAFHICKYDVSSTQSPERFIRRLVGFFAMKIPEYGNIVSMMSSASIVYNDEKCAREQDSCFDQAFRIPFKSIKTEFPTMIVVIDALDECLHSTKNRNFILDLISTRIHYFPKWVKFLITSRDMEQLNSLQKLERLDLLTNASNNIQDIKKYVEIIYNTRSGTFDWDIKQKLLESSEGNFLYIIHALQYVQSPDFNGTLPRLPFSLVDIYELNFDRQFQGGNTYSTARLILEIICTSLTPLKKKDIYNVLRNSKAINTSYSDFEVEFEKLTYFIKMEDGVILRHKALHSWLVNSASSRYRVSLTKGHELISKHLLRSVEKNSTGDITALVIHLSYSKSSALREVFYSFNMKKVMIFKEDEVLHSLISKTKCEEALEMLLFHHTNIDVIDKNGVSAAFLAAAKGHFRQLKLLLRKGANHNFVVNPCRRCDSTIFSKDFKKDIEDIKTIFYSGYGLLHIAVQHGSIKIVRHLIEKTSISLNHENVIGQRPIDIACEMGNIEMFKILISKQSTIVDHKCLYFATKNSHLSMVKQILESGFEATCISNKTAEKELVKILNSCNCFESDVLSPSIKPLDTWWIVFRETPLHLAIRSRFSGISEYIARKTNRYVKCVDSYGYTPFLLAIKYSQYQLTTVLKYRANKDKCFPFASFLTRTDINRHGTIIYEKDEEICQEGATFAHQIAKYSGYEMIDIFEKDTSLKWNIADAIGNYPIHYAASHSNKDFIKFMYQRFGRATLNEKSKNGSTAYHSAAISCSEASLSLFTNAFSDDIPDLKDNDNRSVLQYALMCENKMWSYFPQNNLSLSCQKYLLKLTNTSHVDSNGQNILHYILRYGHANLLDYFQKKNPQLYKNMLYSEDRFRLTPVKYTLFHAPDAEITLSTTLDNFDGTIQNTRSDVVQRSLIPWEKCLINIQSLSPQEETNDFFLRHFSIIIVKSPFLTKALLLNHIFANASFIERANITGQIVYGMKLARYLRRERVFTQSLKTISDVKPALLYSCQQPLNRSPLHYISLIAPWINNYDNSFDMFDAINNSFHITSDNTDLKCSTIDGLNLLHYSIIGGFINLTDYLMEKKLPVVTENVSVIDVLHMAVFSKFKSHINNDYSLTYSLLDTFLSKFIKNRKHELNANIFCRNQSESLSLVHFFAINGMARTIKIVKELFGLEIILCQNSDNLTPLFFAELFGRKSVSALFTEDSSYIFPDRSAVEFLLFNIVNNFPQMRKQNPFRCITSRRMITVHERTIVQNYQCLKRFYKTFFVSINDFFIHNLVFAREGLYLTGKFVQQYLELRRLYSAYFKSKTIVNCSGFTTVLREIGDKLKELKLWSGIRNGYLSWQKEYPFLRNIYNALDLPSYRSIISSAHVGINSDCSKFKFRYISHTMQFLERTLRKVFTSIQDITILVALIDQKGFIRIGSMPFKFNGLEPNLFNFMPDFGFSLCSYCPFFLLKGAVYNVNRFRYLNAIKSTTTYKHFDELRPRNALVFISKTKIAMLKKKAEFMNKMLHKTNKRQKWLLANFKSEKNACCKCQFRNVVENHEENEPHTLYIPLI